MRFRLPLTTAGAILFIAAVAFLSFGCERELAMAPIPLQGTLTSIQANIFTLKCVNRGCHNPNGGGAPMSLQSGLARGNLVGVASAYPGLLRVNPGDAANSALFLKLNGDARVGGALGRMPLNFPALSTDEINAIRDWINAGAPNN